MLCQIHQVNQSAFLIRSKFLEENVQSSSIRNLVSPLPIKLHGIGNFLLDGIGGLIIGMTCLPSSSNTEKIHVKFPCFLLQTPQSSSVAQEHTQAQNSDRLQYIDFTKLSIETKNGRISYEDYELIRKFHRVSQTLYEFEYN